MTQRTFEDRLLDELRGVVVARPAQGSARPARRWHRRLVAVGASAAALAVAAGVGLPLLTGGGTAAYAVTKNDDGSVTVEVSSLQDAAGLQQKLRDAGVPAVVQYIPPGKGCKEQTFTPASPSGQVKGQVGVRAFESGDGTSQATFTISRSMIQPGLTLVIQTATGVAPPAGAPTGGGKPGVPPAGASLLVAWAKGDVKPCELVESSQAAQQPAPLPPFEGAPGEPARGGLQRHIENGALTGPSLQTGGA